MWYELVVELREAKALSVTLPLSKALLLPATPSITRPERSATAKGTSVRVGWMCTPMRTGCHPTTPSKAERVGSDRTSAQRLLWRTRLDRQ